VDQTHEIFGISITCLIILQLIGGWILYAIMVGKNINNSILIIKETHKYVGNSIYIVAKVNVLLGAYLSWEPVYIVGKIL